MTDRASFEKARFWVNQLNNNEQGVGIVIVGTKGSSHSVLPILITFVCD
jgi:hypothetical protein